MAAPVPGLPSFGDMVKLVELCHICIKTLKISGEVGSDFDQDTNFLKCLQETVKDASDHVANNPNSKYSKKLKDDLELLVKPWDDFKEFLEPYEPYLSVNATKSRVSKVPKSIRFAMKEVTGEIQKLKTEIGTTIQCILLTLGFQSIEESNAMKSEVLSAIQIAQITQTTSSIAQFDLLHDILNETEIRNQINQQAKHEELETTMRSQSSRLEDMLLQTLSQHAKQLQENLTSSQADIRIEIESLKAVLSSTLKNRLEQSQSSSASHQTPTFSQIASQIMVGASTAFMMGAVINKTCRIPVQSVLSSTVLDPTPAHDAVWQRPDKPNNIREKTNTKVNAKAQHRNISNSSGRKECDNATDKSNENSHCFWCCNGHGPWHETLHIACMECGHVLCPACYRGKIKM